MCCSTPLWFLSHQRYAFQSFHTPLSTTSSVYASHENLGSICHIFLSNPSLYVSSKYLNLIKYDLEIHLRASLNHDLSLSHPHSIIPAAINRRFPILLRGTTSSLRHLQKKKKNPSRTNGHLTVNKECMYKPPILSPYPGYSYHSPHTSKRSQSDQTPSLIFLSSIPFHHRQQKNKEKRSTTYIINTPHTPQHGRPRIQEKSPPSRS